ncbi:type 4b pilus protein PilO2 [Xanthomonas euvesicatoria]
MSLSNQKSRGRSSSRRRNNERSDEPEITLPLVSCHGKKLAGGLDWVPMRSPRHYQREAREVGKLRGMDMVAIRRSGDRIQAGFAPRMKKRVRGVYSLASVLASVLGKHWIAVFDIGDGRYSMVAVHDSQVLPGSDRIGSREEIESLMQSTYADMHGQAEIEPIICPSEFNFSSDNRTLEEVIGPKAFKKDDELKPLQFGLTVQEIVVLGGGVVFLGALGVGTYIYLDNVKREAAEKAALAAANAQQLAELESKREPARPWVQQPSVDALLAACSKHLDATQLSIGGWLLASVKCAPGRASALYKRGTNGAPLSYFVSDAANFGATPNIFEAGESGTVSAEINLTPDESDTLQPMAKVVMELTDHLQAFGDEAKLEVTPVNVSSAAVEGQPQPTWKTSTFTITTDFPPERLLQDAGTQGIRVLEVTTDLQNETAGLTWTLTGEIYGR